MDKPSIGRIVHYVSRTGKYECPAIVTATKDSLNPEGLAGGFIPDIQGATSEDEQMRVHLTVFTAGKPGKRANADGFVTKPSEPISENVAGCYQEWNIPYSEAGVNDPDSKEAGTWHWPERV